jgi:hypothetical protein
MPPHGPEEVFDSGDERPFQFSLAVLFAQFQKIEAVFVLHRQLGLGAKFWCEVSVPPAH